LFRHAWVGGLDAQDPQRLAEITARLAPARDPAGEAVKAELRRLTEEAAAAGLFGVPSFALAGRHFWGLDALPMLRDALLGGPWFSGPDWDAAAVAPPGVARR
jgi:2-hydroxychromene-2-carboxylate isomerase